VALGAQAVLEARTVLGAEPSPSVEAFAPAEVSAAPVPAGPPSLASLVGETLGFVEEAIARIEAGEGVEAALREMHAFILDILSLIRRDPGIATAADDLLRAAAVLAAAGGGRPDPRRARLLKDAAQRLRARLAQAQPASSPERPAASSLPRSAGRRGGAEEQAFLREGAARLPATGTVGASRDPQGSAVLAPA
jgi:hypothetical protein